MAHRLSKMIHDHAVWVPAWKKPWLRMGHWSWLRFPMTGGPKNLQITKNFKFFWIDTQEKKKSSNAMEKGEPVSTQPSVREYTKYKK